MHSRLCTRTVRTGQGQAPCHDALGSRRRSTKHAYSASTEQSARSAPCCSALQAAPVLTNDKAICRSLYTENHQPSQGRRCCALAPPGARSQRYATPRCLPHPQGALRGAVIRWSGGPGPVVVEKRLSLSPELEIRRGRPIVSSVGRRLTSPGGPATPELGATVR